MTNLNERQILMSYRSILVISDNEQISKEFIAILTELPQLNESEFQFACHPDNTLLAGKKMAGHLFQPLDLKDQCEEVIRAHDLVISAHCRQLFPKALVNKRRCINVHPGYNPYNRGWYPQVFSIINNNPVGATIHEIDEKLDHGRIIDRERVEVKLTDTSLTLYNRILESEFRLLRRNLPAIIDGTYKTFAPEEEGKVHLKADFDRLRELDLDEILTFRAAIDRLRALSHPPFRNAFYVDPQSGEKIWVEIGLEADVG